jgi:hypothetical protein
VSHGSCGNLNFIRKRNVVEACLSRGTLSFLQAFVFDKSIQESSMNFLAKLLKGIAFIPAVVNGIEGLFGGRSGGDKKEAALSFASAALGMTEAVASRDIADEDKFREGLGKVIDGTVQCLNASTWAKK